MPTDDQALPPARRPSWLAAVYRGLASRRFAGVLIALLALLLIVGLFVPQQGNYRPVDFAKMLEGSAFLRALAALQLTDLRGSPLLYGVFSLLFLNLGLNLVERLRALPRALRLPVPRSGADELRRRKQPAEIELTDIAADPLDAAGRVLRRRGYAVVRDGDRLAAVRGRTAVLGSLVFHVSLIVLAVGALVSVATRVHGAIALGEGESFGGGRDQYGILQPSDLPDEDLPELAFHVDSIEAAYDEADNLLDVSAVFVTPDGSRQTVRVNEPYRQGAAAVRLAEYGLAPVFVAREPGKRLEHGAAFRLLVLPPGREDQFQLPPLPYEFRVRMFPDYYEGVDGAPASHSRDLRSPVAELVFESAPGTEHRLLLPVGTDFQPAGDLLFGMPGVKLWARFEVDRDAGRWVVFLGFILALVGLVWRLGFPQQRVDVALDRDEGGGGRLCLAGRADYTRLPFGERFERIVARIGEELRA